MTQAVAPSEGFPLPRVFGRLLLLKQLARGGMGEVYLAATTGIEGAERPCVVKTIRRDHIHDGSFLARFLDEARVQAQLNHPGVAQVLEATTDENGEPFTVVEYIEGRSLAEVRHRSIQVGHRIGWADAVAMSIEMAQALAHVHERKGSDGHPLGIVHRDLSPQNVMIGYAGEVKLIDFGTARGQNRRCHTVAGVVFAKPGYVAPEIARHEVGDGRIDVYALGVMLWELIKNQRLLAGDPQKHMEDVGAGKFQIPKIAVACGAPTELDDVIYRLTANDPNDRYATAGLAAADLAKLLSKAPAGKGGRSVRARVEAMMQKLYSHEPAKSRSEFAKLLKEARALLPESFTPPASRVTEGRAAQLSDDPQRLEGTPYRLLEKIGEGASGVVWKAEHVELGRSLALKVLAPEHSSAVESIDRFRREARAVANVRHPNLAYLHDFGKSLDGRLFLAMELLSGKTLGARIDEANASGTKGIPADEAISHAIAASKALSAAHEAGIVHRDLKPENLFITDDGVLKLLDFGVALAKSDTKQDETRQKGFAIFGTPAYMAPEQVSGDPVDARCDLYALGCVIYEMLAGDPPFVGESGVVVMGQQLRDTAKPIQLRTPKGKVSDELAAIVTKLLEKDPEARYASAAEVCRALELAGAAKTAPKSLAPVVTERDSFADLSTSPLRTFAKKPGRLALVALGFAAFAALGVKLATPAAPLASAPPMSDPSAVTAVAPELPVQTAPNAGAVVESPLTGASAAPSVAAESVAPANPVATEWNLSKADLEAQARKALKDGNLKEARRIGELWARKDGSSAPRIFLASVYDAQGHRAEATRLLSAWVDKHPKDAEAKKALAHFGGLASVATKRPVH
jgi:serine/threonine-protein kinase